LKITVKFKWFCGNVRIVYGDSLCISKDLDETVNLLSSTYIKSAIVVELLGGVGSCILLLEFGLNKLRSPAE